MAKKDSAIKEMGGDKDKQRKRMSPSIDEESTGRKEQKKPNSTIEKPEYMRNYAKFSGGHTTKLRNVRSA